MNRWKVKVTVKVNESVSGTSSSFVLLAYGKDEWEYRTFSPPSSEFNSILIFFVWIFWIYKSIHYNYIIYRKRERVEDNVIAQLGWCHGKSCSQSMILRSLVSQCMRVYLYTYMLNPLQYVNFPYLFLLPCIGADVTSHLCHFYLVARSSSGTKNEEGTYFRTSSTSSHVIFIFYQNNNVISKRLEYRENLKNRKCSWKELFVVKHERHLHKLSLNLESIDVHASLSQRSNWLGINK